MWPNAVGFNSNRKPPQAIVHRSGSDRQVLADQISPSPGMAIPGLSLAFGFHLPR